MRILVKEHSAVISDLVFCDRTIFIGSKPECSVFLPDMRIGEKHAIITMREDGSWRVEALAGHARTMLNGHVLRESTTLSNGDQLSIQDYTLNIYLEMNEEQVEIPPEIAESAEQYPVPHGTITRSKRTEVLLRPEQVDSMATLSTELNGCSDVPSLIDCVLDGLQQRFKAGLVWVGVRRGPKEPLQFTAGKDHRGQMRDTPKLYESLANRCVDRGLNVCVPKFDDPEAHSLVAVPFVSERGRLGFMYVDSKHDQPALAELDLHYAMALAAVITKRLEALMHDVERQRKAVSIAEENIVHTIQGRLDLKVVPEWPQLQVAVHSSPGEVNAGDIFDIMELPNGAAAFLVGHVTAAPADAAVALIEARTAFRIAVLHSDMPHVVLSELNWLLCSQAEPVIMDCAIVMVDPRNGALLHAVAGRTRGVIISQNGSYRQLANPNRVELGKSRNYQFTTQKGLMGVDESLALYTPGLLKLRDADEQVIDERRVLESLCDGFGASARAALDETVSDLSPYLNNGYQTDDVILLLAHRRKA